MNYTVDDLVTGLRNPRKIVLEANRLYHRQFRDETGIKVMEQDWDNLLILDACRYDLFKNLNTINGALRAVISGGSSTSGFLQYNFTSDYFSDTVYISANPQTRRHRVEDRFYNSIRLWEEQWNDKLHTVLPKDVTDRTLKIAERYPNKRLIVHYIQPHYPFIGETGKQIQHRSIRGDGVIEQDRELASVWDQLETGAITKEKVWEAYKENFTILLPEVRRAVNELNGKTVVTSDHGNSFGEFGVYGHPGGIFLESLVKVPWLVVDDGDRREINGETRSGTVDETTANIEDRLADLGYM